MAEFRGLLEQAGAGDRDAAEQLPAAFEALVARACSQADAPRDDAVERAEIDEHWLGLLAASGVNRAFQNVAARIGFVHFMEMWAALSDESVLDERRRVHVPQMEATLLRYQRAKMIQELGRRGLKPGQIIRALPKTLRGHISRRTVVRILTGK